MRITKPDNGDGRRGNAVAIGLSALAVVIAATGTAVAVAPSSFSIADHVHAGYFLKIDKSGRLTTTSTAATNSATIADHAHPTQYLKIDSSGRLTTTVQTTTLNLTNTALINNNLDTFVVSPTTAQFAVTHIGASSLPTNSATYNVSLLQTPVNSDGVTCSTATASKEYTYQIMAPGDNVDADYATPLAVKGLTSAKYCLDMYVYRVSGTANPSDQVFVEFDGYVESGSYTVPKARSANSTVPLGGKIRAPK